MIAGHGHDPVLNVGSSLRGRCPQCPLLVKSNNCTVYLIDDRRLSSLNGVHSINAPWIRGDDVDTVLERANTYVQSDRVTYGLSPGKFATT